ncbi:3-oxoadipyl-CoA thiolase [Thalassococcus sp. S3]|uniref:3-oxoadipyl-CoA thiolase n=1 Tax=Thalassococcus sp. S3 TaxID=2017482 RepID=UPI0010240518|nr:3-oxoadipyl-CoA thiolase [Thalassococcus sp. S3]QBF29878.1 3-oxoadipyl-CoA thiolase [Thalassococcus sp. S3]
MTEAYLCDGIRTPIGRYGGALSKVRPDDMLAHVIREVMKPHPEMPVDEVLMGCANQAGEDNRNVARMAVLLAGLPDTVPGATINRLCGSGLDAIGSAARAVRTGEAEVVIAGGVESMSRAPMVMPKADAAFSRKAEIYDTTIGWRFVNRAMHKHYGTDSMPETAENVAEDHQIGRADQDAFALRSQERAAAAQASGRLAREIVAVKVPQRRGEEVEIATDEHPRQTTLEKLGALSTPFRDGGTVTAGNASGVNDGAAAVIVASAAAVEKYGLTPRARITGMATVGVAPRVMGIGPAPATEKLMAQHGLGIAHIDTIELNEAFAAQGLAVTRQLGLPDDADHVNPHGGAIALGHPLGMSGARLALTASLTMTDNDMSRAICTMCIGVGQGIALLLEKA